VNRKLVALVVGLLGLGSGLGDDAFACGDKLIVVGRGLRPKRKAASHASILAFAPASGSLPAALDEGGLQRELVRAGHRLSRVDTDDELQKALGAGGYDLVLADFPVASRVETAASRAPAHPTVLPTLYKPTPAQLKAAETEFQCVIASPGKQKDYLSVVDEAMTARARQAKAAKAP
jgi:hypothetical protein